MKKPRTNFTGRNNFIILPLHAMETGGLFSKNNLTSEDYYLSEEGYKVFTEAYHLKRGYCCKNGCRHCPYGFNKRKK